MAEFKKQQKNLNPNLFTVYILGKQHFAQLKIAGLVPPQSLKWKIYEYLLLLIKSYLKS